MLTLYPCSVVLCDFCNLSFLTNLTEGADFEVLTGQDKWRNISVMANGCGSRQRGRHGNKSTRQTPKHVDVTVDLSTVVANVPELVDAKTTSVIRETDAKSGSKKPISRF